MTAPPTLVQVRAQHAYNGRDCSWALDRTTTVGQLKELIAGDMGVPVEKQRLVTDDNIRLDKDSDALFGTHLNAFDRTDWTVHVYPRGWMSEG